MPAALMPALMSGLTAPRLLGGVLLVKAADVLERGPQDLPATLWALVLAGWVVAAVALVLGREPWSLVVVCGAAFAVDYPQDLRRQHLVLLVGLALAALVAGDERERLLLWRTQLTALYGFAVLAKLNESFLSGSVVAADVVDAPFWSGLLPVPGPSGLVLLSVALVLTELALAVGLWLRRGLPGLLLAVAFHGGALLLVGVSPMVALRLVVFGGAAAVAYAACAGVLPGTGARTSVEA